MTSGSDGGPPAPARGGPERLAGGGAAGPARRAILAEVERIATERWAESPGEGGGRVPASRSALAEMEAAIAAAADAAEADPSLARELLPFVRTCLWARRPVFAGTWALAVGAAAVVVALLAKGRDGGAPWLAAAVVWAASVPLYLQAAVALQVDLVAEVAAGRLGPDARFVRQVAAGPPLLTPLWLAARALLYGALAPAFVLLEAARRRRPLPAVVLLGVATLAALWSWLRLAS